MAIFIKNDKNLFDITKAEPATSTTYIDIQNNSIEFAGTTGGRFDIPLPAEGAYTLSFKRNTAGGIILRNGKVTSGYFAMPSAESTVVNFGTGSGGYTGGADGCLRIETFKSGLILSDIQIEKYKDGNPTAYTPYGGHRINLYVKSDKNLFDISKVENVGGVINNGDGSLTLTAYACTSTARLKNICPSLKVGDEIVINFKTQSTISKWVYINGNQIPTNKKFIVTDAIFDKSIVWYGYHKNEGAKFGQPCKLWDIQIEKGEKVTTYVPYVPYGRHKVDLHLKDIINKI